VSELLFDWDSADIGHIAEHDVTPEEAEQVIKNRPFDLESHLRSGEERTAQVGETDAGRILIVVSTMRSKRIRIVPAWPANKNYRRYFLSMKRSGNVGRIEEQRIRE
jgi:hypothetical protein